MNVYHMCMVGIIVQTFSATTRRTNPHRCGFFVLELTSTSHTSPSKASQHPAHMR